MNAQRRSTRKKWRTDYEHLDAAESVHFNRGLEAIETKLYQTIYAELKARKLLGPATTSLPEWAKRYTYRMFDKFGMAKWISNYASDLPLVGVKGTETSTMIRRLGAAFQFDTDEIAAAAATGAPLEETEAMAVRRVIEEKVDKTIGVGDALVGIKGLLNLANTTTVTAGTKGAGGLLWSVATADEIAADIFGLLDGIALATYETLQANKLIMPIGHKRLIGRKRMSPDSDETVLDYVLANAPQGAGSLTIESWHRCLTAGAGSTTRMVAFPDNGDVVGYLVNQEFRMEPPQQKNFAIKTNCTAKCGGVISRYPVAVGYMDGT